uniref:Protein kinase domain-containing protein n=1 Tax=Fagus sylvatica TaxID=28930 RepID=A0A2N9J4B3_FAGSY
MVPKESKYGGHGLTIIITPSLESVTYAISKYFLGLFNVSKNGLSTNHVLAIELDTVVSPEFQDIDDNHVGIDVNNLKSIESATAAYFSNQEGKNISMDLESGDSMHLWTDYDDTEKLLNVTLAPTSIPKPNWPLLLTHINLSPILLESMYIGFSAATDGALIKVDNHKALIGAAYVLRRKKFEEIREDWEREYGPQRFTYKNLYKATKVKKVSHDSKQGMKEFVAEIISMGRLRHRNLVQLLGYCRRKGELILVYDYMPNGSLNKFLNGKEKKNLNWLQRFQILKGVASSLLYLHEEWEQVVLHRDELWVIWLLSLLEQEGQPPALMYLLLGLSCLRKGAILEASDPRLDGDYVEEEMELVLKLVLLCSHSMPASRPSMRQVMQFLDGNVDLPELPHDSACFGYFTREVSEIYLSIPSSFGRGSAPSFPTTDSILKSGH